MDRIFPPKTDKKISAVAMPARRMMARVIVLTIMVAAIVITARVLPLLNSGPNSGSILLGQMANAQTASAKSIVDQAKALGKIGEGIDGYLAKTGGALSSTDTAAMYEINIRRKSVYTKLARKQGVEVGIVARLSGEKLIAKAPAGQKVMGTNRQWRTK